jgi:hypothetical protein
VNSCGRRIYSSEVERIALPESAHPNYGPAGASACIRASMRGQLTLRLDVVH